MPPQITLRQQCQPSNRPAPSSPAEAAQNETAPKTESKTAPVEESVLTVENSADLAELLITDTCSNTVGDFAAKYEGQTIAFDASIGAMQLHGGCTTRYDILISVGNYSETTSTGPFFQFRDVNTVSDLHYDDRPDTIGVGDNLHVTARLLSMTLSPASRSAPSSDSCGGNAILTYYVGYVTGPGADTRILLGAVCELVLITTNIGTAVVLFPVLRRHSETAAIGYLAARIVECAFIAVGILSILAVVTLRQTAGADAAEYLPVAQALVALHGWTFLLSPGWSGSGTGCCSGS